MRFGGPNHHQCAQSNEVYKNVQPPFPSGRLLSSPRWFLFTPKSTSARLVASVSVKYCWLLAIFRYIGCSIEKAKIFFVEHRSKLKHSILHYFIVGDFIQQRHMLSLRTNSFNGMWYECLYVIQWHALDSKYVIKKCLNFGKRMNSMCAHWLTFIR